MRSDSNTSENRKEIESFSFLPWGYTYKANESWETSRNLKDILEILIGLIPDEILIKNELSNLCGGTQSTIGDRELLSITYTIRDTEPDSLKENGVEENGRFAITSRFARFEGNKAIVFKLNRSDSHGATNPREFLLDRRRTITEISVSMEWYERRWASLFGLFPVATKTLRLVVNEREGSIEVNVQRQATKEIARKEGELLLSQFISMSPDGSSR